MSFNISAWSIRQPVPTIVLFLVLTVMGLATFPFLGIDATPNIDVPSVLVGVTQIGADPSELETQVTKKVEDAVAGLGNIDHITSTVNDGLSTTQVDFVLGTDSDRATNDVRNAVAQIRQDLPEDINDPIVERLDFVGGSIMSYAVSSPQRSVEALSDLVDRPISRALLAVPGVSQVQRLGGVDREIRVDLHPDRLQALGITATEVNDQLQALNINLPGGRTDIGNSEQSVRTLGSAVSVESLKNYNIVLPQGGSGTSTPESLTGETGIAISTTQSSEDISVPLSSLAEVTNSVAEPRQTALLDNKPVVAFAVLRSRGSTLASVEAGARAAVEQLQKTLPDVQFNLIFTRADFVHENYHASIDALLLGAGLTVLTILVFLRDWRAMLITAVALPLSVIPTFAVLKALGYTLNNMTLLALALVVGILVDDAIVEIENIERHMQMGKTPYRAALDASDEIGLAVVATTMSIVAVFVPVAFMGGLPGQFFRPFGVTIVASVLFSLLVARTVTPLMAAYLLKDRRHPQGQLQQDRFSFQYRRLLVWGLRHRVTTLMIAVIFLGVSLLLVPFIPTGLFGSADEGLSQALVELPPGSTLRETDQTVRQLTQLFLTSPVVARVLATEGASGSASSDTGTSGVNQATLFVKLKPRQEREISQQQFEQQTRQQFRQIPGARISFLSQEGVGSSKDVSVALKSENSSALNQVSEALTQQMQQLSGLVEVTSSASLVKPEILIQPDAARAGDQGVSVETIARTAFIAMLGDTEAELAKFDLPDDRQIPIRVQLDPRFRSDINTLKNLQVPTKNGTLVPLVTVANIELASGPSQIDRLDRSRQVSVEANLQGIAIGDAFNAVYALPALNPLPPDVTRADVGNAQLMNDIFTNFGAALAAAVLFIYTVLVLLFSNFLHPLTIMVALPLSLGGALLGLLIGQEVMGLFALIGIVLLMGLVTKNSILLVDYALMNQKVHGSQARAVLESGVSRLRPILMTTIAMIAGMVPIALGVGAGSEVRSPMAIAVIGGLMTSTLLTLIVIPIIFTYIDDFQAWIFNEIRPL